MKYLVFCLLITFINGAPPSTRDQLINDVIRSVEKLLGFFSQDYSDINVDGLFGLRLGQGQLIEAVQECKTNPRCPNTVLLKLKALEKTLSDTCDKALPYVRNYDEDYYQRFKDTIDKPYLLPYQPTIFDKKDLSSSEGKDSSYNEDVGDACYARLMGTFKEDEKMLPKCNVTSSCWDLMSSSGTARYAITHQLLYFIVVENVGCTSQIETFNHGGKIWDIQKEFCSKIYKEASDLVTDGQVMIANRDLFLEQSVLCGSLGFEDFMRQDWIKMTLQWPDKKYGCFKMTLSQADQAADNMVKTIAKYEGITDSNIIEKYEKQIEEKIDKTFNENESLFGNLSTMRKLLREKGMKDNCLSHTSGLGFGTFATYLRYLVRHI